MLGVIRSYLVSLGYTVDQSSFQQAMKSMGNLQKNVEQFADKSGLKLGQTNKGFQQLKATVAEFAGTTGGEMIIAGAGVEAFLATVTVAIGKFVTDVAAADLQNQIFARQMWMNVDAARSYQTSLKALGVSLQDLYLSPELMQKFLSLREQAGQITPPADFGNTMKGVRNITFELQRMKLEASYSLQWIGYYLAKDLAGPAGNFATMLKHINDDSPKTCRFGQRTWPRWQAILLGCLMRQLSSINGWCSCFRIPEAWVKGLSKAWQRLAWHLLLSRVHFSP